MRPAFFALEAALSGIEGYTQPWSWFISQLCESFGCTPLQVLRDLGYQLDAVPWPVLVEILDFRAYHSARRDLLRAEQHDDVLLQGPQYDLVRDIRSRVQQAQIARLTS